MIMSFKCSSCLNIVFDHLKINFDVVNVVLMYQIPITYQDASWAVCANAHVFRKGPGCALIGACALVITNMGYIISGMM